MNQQKFDAVYRGMTIQAKKVYDAIPIQEGWTPAQIMGELRRRNISMTDKHVVLGCINSMIDSGLIVESPKGVFRREPVRPKFEQQEQLPEPTPPAKEPEPMSKTPAPAPAKDVPPSIDPITRLSALAINLRALAAELESAAVDLAMQFEQNDAETEKMRQLKSILKSLG